MLECILNLKLLMTASGKPQLPDPGHVLLFIPTTEFCLKTGPPLSP